MPDLFNDFSLGLDNSNQLIREKIAEHLKGYEGKDAYRLLSKALSDQNAKVRKSAAAALENYEGADAFKLFERGLSDKDLEVRMAAAYSLKNYKEENAHVLFEKALSDPSSVVRETAASGLKDFKSSDPQFKQKLLPILVDLLKRDSNIRKEIVGVIKTSYPGLNDLYHQNLTYLKDYLKSPCDRPIHEVLSVENLNSLMQYLNEKNW